MLAVMISTTEQGTNHIASWSVTSSSLSSLPEHACTHNTHTHTHTHPVIVYVLTHPCHQCLHNPHTPPCHNNRCPVSSLLPSTCHTPLLLDGHRYPHCPLESTLHNLLAMLVARHALPRRVCVCVCVPCTLTCSSSVIAESVGSAAAISIVDDESREMRGF